MKPRRRSPRGNLIRVTARCLLSSPLFLIPPVPFQADRTWSARTATALRSISGWRNNRQLTEALCRLCFTRAFQRNPTVKGL